MPDWRAALEWLLTEDSISRVIGLIVWTIVSGMLSVPAYRRLFGRPVYLDDLLFAAWLLTLNRVCFSVQSLVHNDTWGDVSRWTGIGAGIFYAYVVSSYVRARRG